MKELTAAEKIQQALVECLKEKTAIESITISYITEKAGVGKSPFYRNYKDIYDVYEQLVAGFVERCENLISRIFFENSITVKDVARIILKHGIFRDNELFYLKDYFVVKYAVEMSDTQVFDILYDKMHAMIVRIAKKVYDDDEAADFGATFILNGNMIPMLLNLHSNGRINFKTVMLSFELFEMEVEKWKQHQPH